MSGLQIGRDNKPFWQKSCLWQTDAQTDADVSCECDSGARAKISNY